MTLHRFILCKLKAVFRKTKRLTISEDTCQEQREIKEIGDMVDHISTLPDCILHQILSSMPTKDLVKTSILSTRWNNLWASAPNIDFDDGLLFATKVDGQFRPEVFSFMNFVERVLQLRDASNIEKFCLSCFVCNNASKIHSWISYAIIHKVQELDLCLFGDDPSVIPKFMFNSSSLVSLKIKMDCVIELPSHLSFPFLKTLHLSLVRFPDDDCIDNFLSGCPFLEELALLDCYLVSLNSFVVTHSMVDSTSLVSLKIRMKCDIELPAHVFFPCLKTLHLSLVRFPDDDFAENLFSACPVLEELVLLECYLANVNNIVILNFTLKSLTIHDLSYYYDEFDDRSGCNIDIDAANLTYFEYVGYLSNEILLNDALSVVKACICIPTPHEGETEVTCRAVDLLKQLRYVVSLSISNRIMECLMFANKMVHHSPVFANLSHLVLTMESGNYPFGGLMDLLYLCPLLHSICFLEGFEHYIDLGENDPTCLSVPVCMSNCLKTVTFKNFDGNDSEIFFLKFILKYACVLERMDIWWSKTWVPDLKKQAQAMTEFETIKRSSTTCVVNFL